MSSRDTILANLRKAAEGYDSPMPDLASLAQRALAYDNPLEQFCKALSASGGRAVILEDGKTLDSLVKELYPDSQRIVSGIKGVSGQSIETVEDPATLDGTDVAIVNGQFGVAENGAVWIQQDIRQRAAYFISEALVIVINKENIVQNMHQAYRRIGESSDYEFGIFISGPSKTADIEQALVFGAHGAREVTVVLTSQGHNPARE